MPRTDPRQRQVEKEAIQIGMIERIATQDQRHMRIEAPGLAPLANSNDRHRRETLPPDPPPGN
ncbi:transcriptional regulator [Sphingopyxis sp. EG6]|nr:transcriptional regulator [Sphingopyxis sp. EG6]